MGVCLWGFSALQRAEIAEIVWAMRGASCRDTSFSALQRAEIAETQRDRAAAAAQRRVSVLFNEPKLLKVGGLIEAWAMEAVSVLFNEPKLLKGTLSGYVPPPEQSFSALQRAEIAEIDGDKHWYSVAQLVSVLFNEPKLLKSQDKSPCPPSTKVSVLFNEPKLLKRAT